MTAPISDSTIPAHTFAPGERMPPLKQTPEGLVIDTARIEADKVAAAERRAAGKRRRDDRKNDGPRMPPLRASTEGTIAARFAGEHASPARPARNDRPRIKAIRARACPRCGAEAGHRCIPTTKPTHRERMTEGS